MAIDEGLYSRKAKNTNGVKFFTSHVGRDASRGVEISEDDLRSDLKKITPTPDVIIDDLVMGARRNMPTTYQLSMMTVWAEIE